MREYLKFHIDGQWADSAEPRTIEVENPTTEQICGQIAIGTSADGDFGFRDYLGIKGIAGYGSRISTD